LSVAFNAAIAALLNSGFPMVRMAFAVSCLLSSNGNLRLDPDASEEEDSSINFSEHFVVYDPNDFSKSIAMNHFGTFDLEAVFKVSKIMFDSGVMPIHEEIKSKVIEDIESKI
jgi:ribonuclease PH